MSMPLSDDLNHKQLYLLEVLVKTVEITDESNTDQEKPLFVRVKFLDFPSLEITRKDFLKQKDKDVNTNRVDVTESIDANFADNDTDPSREQGSKVVNELKAGSVEVNPEDETLPGDPSSFNIGKSCMFPMLPLELIKQIQRYPLVIQIYCKNRENEYDLVGGARVRLGPDFEDLIIEAGEEDTQLPVSNILESELPVKDIFGVPIGKIDIFIRLSCYGVTIVNQFQLIGENGEYMFRNDKKDNTLQAQKNRSFIFGQEPFATASILNRLIHPSDVRGLKPIVTTEDNTLPIKGAEPDQEQRLAPQLNPNGRFKFVTRAGELQGQAPRSFIPQNWATSMKSDEMKGTVIPAHIDPEKLASIHALLKGFLTGNNSGLGGQKTTCCDSCCEAKGHGIGRPIEIKNNIARLPDTIPYQHPKDHAGNIDKFFFGPFKNQKQGHSEESEREVSHSLPHSPAYDNPGMIQKIVSGSLQTIPRVWNKISDAASDMFGATELIDAETLAWALAIQHYNDFLPDDSSHEKTADTKRFDFKKDQHRVVKLPDSLPITNDGVEISKFAHKPIDRNGLKGKDDKQCFFANKHEEQKANPTISKLSSLPCQIKEVGDMINSNTTTEKHNGASNIDEKVDSSLEFKSDHKNNQLEKQVEKHFEHKPEVLIGGDQSGFVTNEERMIKVPETPDTNRFSAKTQQAKSDSTLTKSATSKTRRKDSAEMFKEYKGKLGKKNASKLERKLDSPSTRMRKKYMSIYKYTDGMYPGMNVGHRHCTHLSKCVPKSMGWLWNTSDSGDGLKKRRGWKPGAINKTIANMIKMTKIAAGIEVAVEEEKPKNPKKVVRKVRRPISAGSGTTSTNETTDDYDYYDSSPLPPTLHVHKKDGVYFISMNPLRLEDDDEEQVPLMFKIDADPSTSSSESSLEIECTAPGALRRRLIKPPPVCQDKQTATEDV